MLPILWILSFKRQYIKLHSCIKSHAFGVVYFTTSRILCIWGHSFVPLYRSTWSKAVFWDKIIVFSSIDNCDTWYQMISQRLIRKCLPKVHSLVNTDACLWQSQVSAPHSLHWCYQQLARTTRIKKWWKSLRMRPITWLRVSDAKSAVSLIVSPAWSWGEWKMMVFLKMAMMTI